MKLVKAKKLFAGMNGKNPYFAPFFLLALVCIFSLCGFFYILLYNNTQHTHDVYCQERVELIAEDFDNQLDVFEDIALQISITDKYNPFFFIFSKKSFSSSASMVPLTDLPYESLAIYE